MPSGLELAGTRTTLCRQKQGRTQKKIRTEEGSAACYPWRKRYGLECLSEVHCSARCLPHCPQDARFHRHHDSYRLLHDYGDLYGVIQIAGCCG